VCFPFVSVGNSLHVFRCRYSWKTGMISSGEYTITTIFIFEVTRCKLEYVPTVTGLNHDKMITCMHAIVNGIQIYGHTKIWHLRTEEFCPQVIASANVNPSLAIPGSWHCNYYFRPSKLNTGSPTTPRFFNSASSLMVHAPNLSEFIPCSLLHHPQSQRSGHLVFN